MWTRNKKFEFPWCTIYIASHIIGFAPSSVAYKMLWLMLSQAQRSCYRGLPEPSSLRGKTLGTKAAEHKGCNWGMQVDWWLQPCAGFDNSWHNYAQGSNWGKAGAGMKIITIPVPFTCPLSPPKPIPQRRNQIKISEGVNWGQSPNRGREAPEITPENWGRSLNRRPEAPKNWGQSPNRGREAP